MEQELSDVTDIDALYREIKRINDMHIKETLQLHKNIKLLTKKIDEQHNTIMLLRKTIDENKHDSTDTTIVMAILMRIIFDNLHSEMDGELVGSSFEPRTAEIMKDVDLHEVSIKWKSYPLFADSIAKHLMEYVFEKYIK